MDGFPSSIKLFRFWPTGHQASDPFSSSSPGQFDSTSSLAPSRGRHHHRSYAPYPILSTYAFNKFQSAMGLLSCVGSQQFDRHPFLFPLRKSSREVIFAEVGINMSHLSWILAEIPPSRPITPLTDGQEIFGPSWTPLDFSDPFPYPSYPPLPDWHNPPPTVEAVQTPSIPSNPSVGLLPPLPVIQTEPVWEDANYSTTGTNAQSTSTSPAHSPFRDTPTPIDQSEGGSKGKKRSRGSYRKEDPADRYLRESVEDGNRLWTCMWVEPSHGTPNSPAAQNICGHQAPKSNARQHVKSRHLKLRYVKSFSSRRLFFFPLCSGPTTETHALLSVFRILFLFQPEPKHRPYTCPECGRTWRDQGARYNHRVREHGYVPKKPKRWLDNDATAEGATSSDSSHLNVSFVMESVGQ